LFKEASLKAKVHLDEEGYFDGVWEIMAEKMNVT
jgi:hypothetical protein